MVLSSCLKEVKMSNLNVGKKVSIKGKVSEMPWQHMIQQFESHPHIYYIDWEGDQTVVYITRAIE
jgi:hypothetical protein